MMSSVIEHLPALQVVIPLLGAVLVALVRERHTSWLIATVVSFAMPFISFMLLIQVLHEGPISYHLGGWEPPFGIEYRVDVLNAFILVLVSAISAVMMPYARRSVSAEIDPEKQGWFYCMYLLCLTGLLGIAITGDAFNAFVFMEVSSLATYVLIALGKDRRALLAAYQYLIMGTIGATLYVIGVGLLYLLTGTLNIADIADKLGAASVDQFRPAMAALAFITVGISLKLALFPLHAWLPNAYAYAPSFATAFLAATATKVAVYLFLRFFFSVFGIAIAASSLKIMDLLLILSIAAMFIASILAVYEENVKRMLAFSSVAQIGYITLGVALANQAGLTGGVVHLFNHAVMKGALFLALGAVALRLGNVTLKDLGGIGHKMPITMGAFVIAALGLIGVPGTAGFISKWYLVSGAFESGSWVIGFLIVASSLISVIYVGRVVEVAYFRDPGPISQKAADPSILMLIPILVLTGATIWLGIDTHLTVGVAGRIAETLLGGLN